MAIAENIKNLREARGVTHDKMGAELGVTGTTVYRWESGERNPKKTTVEAVEGVVGIIKGEPIERAVAILIGLLPKAKTNPEWYIRKSLENNWQPDPATRGKASFVIDNGNVLLDEGAEWKSWAVAYRKITGYTVAEARVDPMRKDLLADIDRFVRSLG